MRYIYMLLLTFFILQPACVGYCANNAIEPAVLSVDGTGKAVSTPDQAIISIGVSSHSVNAETAQNINSQAAMAIKAALLELGINETDIQTNNYSFNPVYSTAQNGHSLVDYAVDNNVIVIVNDISLVGNVIDLSLANGANRINSLDFSLRDTSQLHKKAMEAAIKDARNKAEIIANSLGHRIIGIKNVTNSEGNVQSRDFSMMRFSNFAASNTPISPGSLEVVSNIHIDFILDN